MIAVPEDHLLKLYTLFHMPALGVSVCATIFSSKAPSVVFPKFAFLLLLLTQASLSLQLSFIPKIKAFII